MSIKAFGKRFSWEDTLFFYGHDEEGENAYAKVLGYAYADNRSQPRSLPGKPEADFSRCRAVYLLHQQNGEVIYIGQARNLLPRLLAHTRNDKRGRWTHYSWFSIDDPVSPSEALIVSETDVEEADVELTGTASMDVLEAILIETHEPKLNIESGDWRNAQAKGYPHYTEYEWMYLREVYTELVEIKAKLRRKRLKKIIS